MQGFLSTAVIIRETIELRQKEGVFRGPGNEVLACFLENAGAFTFCALRSQLFLGKLLEIPCVH